MSKKNTKALENTIDDNWPLGTRNLWADQAIQIARNGYEVTVTSGEVITADDKGQLFVNGLKRTEHGVRMSWPSGPLVDDPSISCVVRKRG